MERKVPDFFKRTEGKGNMENIFLQGRKSITFEEYLRYDENSRGNLGEELPVLVYRMLEYSLREELCRRFGKDEQIDIFRKAGRMAGEYFARKMLNLDQPLDPVYGRASGKASGTEDRSFAY